MSAPAWSPRSAGPCCTSSGKAPCSAALARLRPVRPAQRAAADALRPRLRRPAACLAWPAADLVLHAGGSRRRRPARPRCSAPTHRRRRRAPAAPACWPGWSAHLGGSSCWPGPPAPARWRCAWRLGLLWIGRAAAQRRRATRPGRRACRSLAQRCGIRRAAAPARGRRPGQSRSRPAGGARWCWCRPPAAPACRRTCWKPCWPTNSATSSATTTWSTCCRTWSKPCCSTTRPCGGCRAASAPNASRSPTTSPRARWASRAAWRWPCRNWRSCSFPATTWPRPRTAAT